MKLGLHSSIFPDALNVLQKIEYTQQVGYKAIELEMGPLYQSSSIPPRNIVARFLDKKTRSEILEHARGHDVKICSLCFGMHMTPAFNLVDPDPRFRDLAVSQIRETIDLAVELEAETILVFINEIAPTRILLSKEKKITLLKDSLLKLVRFTEDAGIKLGLEPSAPSFFASWNQILTVLNDVRSENIGCYYDIGNALIYGLEPEKEMMKLGDAIIQIHLKESRKPAPGRSLPSFPSLGQGTMEWNKIFCSLKNINYRDYLIVELFPDPSDPHRVAMESKKLVEKYLSQS